MPDKSRCGFEQRFGRKFKPVSGLKNIGVMQEKEKHLAECIRSSAEGGRIRQMLDILAKYFSK